MVTLVVPDVAQQHGAEPTSSPEPLGPRFKFPHARFHTGDARHLMTGLKPHTQKWGSHLGSDDPNTTPTGFYSYLNLGKNSLLKIDDKAKTQICRCVEIFALEGLLFPAHHRCASTAFSECFQRNEGIRGSQNLPPDLPGSGGSKLRLRTPEVFLDRRGATPGLQERPIV